MITTHHAEPCWEVIDTATGKPPEYESGDGWAHHETRAKAMADRDERVRDYPGAAYGVARSFGRPCARIVCDGCGDELDASGEGWTHFDPNEHPPIQVSWADIEWVERGEKHYHEEHAPPWCEDCEVEGHDVDDCPKATP